MTQVLRNLMGKLMHPELKYRGPSLIEHIEKCRKCVEKYPKIWNEGKVEAEDYRRKLLEGCPGM